MFSISFRPLWRSINTVFQLCCLAGNKYQNIFKSSVNEQVDIFMHVHCANTHLHQMKSTAMSINIAWFTWKKAQTNQSHEKSLRRITICKFHPKLVDAGETVLAFLNIKLHASHVWLLSSFKLRKGKKTCWKIPPLLVVQLWVWLWSKFLCNQISVFSLVLQNNLG